ncbi:MAG: hypothetical protein MZW92_25545 [Comamonadaceae bacterium]|nr:hypothetical protein [Comamonadaceae bacterium]
MPHLPYDERTASTSNTVDMAICPKGQAGHPERPTTPTGSRKVLKRAGKRGEDKWTTVPFDQAIDEIVNGGKLFSHVPGEENREVTGLKEHLRAAATRRSPRRWRRTQRRSAQGEGQEAGAWRSSRPSTPPTSHYLIDPDHPDFGPKNNQFVYMWGRKKGGRGDFSARFFDDYFGTVNTHGHTTVCQGSLYFTCKAMSEQYVGQQVQGRPEVLLAGRLRELRVHPLRRLQPLRRQLRPVQPERPRSSQRLVDGKTEDRRRRPALQQGWRPRRRR